MNRLIPTPGAVTGTADPTDWRDRAACREASGEEFFGPGGAQRVPSSQVFQTWRRYCEPCPVRAECLEDAIRLGERWGIRGGQDMARLSRRARANVLRAG